MYVGDSKGSKDQPKNSSNVPNDIKQQFDHKSEFDKGAVAWRNSDSASESERFKAAGYRSEMQVIEKNLIPYDDLLSGEAVIDGKNRNVDPYQNL